MVQQEYVFDDHHHSQEKKGGLGKFIWNSETREFLGRDGASWGKVSLFYAIFYTVLGSFFVGMLAVFVKFLPTDKPTYYGSTSIMDSRTSPLNPGLGFRPQIDVEDHSIFFDPTIKEHPTLGYLRYVNNLKYFLDEKYPDITSDNSKNVIKCVANQTYDKELESGSSCEFNYKEAFKTTVCREEDNFGFNTKKPCILIKLNKIISWKPETASNYIGITCNGETSADKDNLLGVTYHSLDDLNNNKHGSLDAKFYPFYGQKSYRAPFVWAQFDVIPNTLVNIECNATALNIDTTDRLNKRGQTKFSLFVKQN